ncbi:MAG: phosphatase PAP2 family protein [Bacteroidales bacterium]|nr:phosphatase PAP2 family protein [Bacteroidales bacterium]
MDIQQLIELDKELLLAINGCHNLFWDGCMWVVTDTKTWIPVAAMLLYVIFKNNKPVPALLALVMLALCITLSDQFASGLCKPYFHRFRPAQDPALQELVHIVNGYRGGAYGFISSHAANTFTVATFVALLLRKPMTTFFLYTWACVPSYSRMYLGVHYPGDIVCGALAGTLFACLVYALYVRLLRCFADRPTYISDQYTHSGYEVADLLLLHAVLLLTYFYAMVMGMVKVAQLHL